MAQTYSIKAFGCKVNRYNADRTESALIRAGLEKAKENPDIFVLFFCSVTENALRECNSELRRAEKNSKKVFVSGCFGNRAFGGGEILEELNVLPRGHPDPGKSARPVVSVQEGCSSFCSFCVVNYLRGRPLSRSADSVSGELSYLESLEYSEAVISGISLGRIEGGMGSFLFRILDKTESICLRLGSLNPGDILKDRDFLTVLSQKRIMPHIHLSLQSGSADVLKDMMRRYEPGDVLELVSSLRRTKPGSGVGVDLIAGFPTEEKRHHRETLDFIEKLSPSFTHVFPFSPRKKTLANLYTDVVGDKEREIRARELRELTSEITRKFLHSLAGTQRHAVIERKRGDIYTARTDNYVIVRFQSSEDIRISSRAKLLLISPDPNGKSMTGKFLEKLP